MPMIVPIALGLGVVALVFASRAPEAAPAPGPTPVPGPISADLLGRMTALLQRVQTDPRSVDPVELDTLATQFQATGRLQEAEALRQAAAVVRLARGEPAPGGGAPGSAQPMGPGSGSGRPFDPTICTPNSASLPEGTRNQLNTLLRLPDADPSALERLANQLEACGFPTEVAQLREKARALRVVRGVRVATSGLVGQRYSTYPGYRYGRRYPYRSDQRYGWTRYRWPTRPARSGYVGPIYPSTYR